MADPHITAVQVCTKCGESKPHTDEFFPRLSDGRGKKPLQRYCRECWKAAEREYQRKRYAERRDEILARNRAYRAAHPEIYRKSDAKRRATPERIAYEREQKKRAWKKCDREAKAEKLRAWKAANPEKVRAMWVRTYAKHSEARKARGLAWRRENPEAAAAIRDRRRAKETGAGGTYSKDDVRALLASQGRVCRYCSAALTKFHVDHFIPLARGGTNWPENLVLSCAPCNFSKSDKMPWEFRPDLFRPPP